MSNRGKAPLLLLLPPLLLFLMLAALAVLERSVPAAPSSGQASGQHPAPAEGHPRPVPPETKPPVSPPPVEKVNPAPPEEKPVTPSDGDKPSSSFQVLGYYAEDFNGDDHSYNSLGKAQAVTSVASFSYLLDQEGNIAGREPGRVETLANTRKLQRFALVHNFQNGGFDRSLAKTLLDSPQARLAAVRNIVSLVRDGGFQGVHLDLENVDPSQRAQFTSFFQELADALHAEGYLATLALPAKNRDDPDGQWSGAYDYAALGRAADLVTLMTYDQHWAGGNPGPVAGIDWVTSVVKYAQQQIPARKILLGLAAYGYQWGSDGGRMLPASDAESLASRTGSSIVWDDASQTPTFSYRQGEETVTVWFENTRSVRRKLALVASRGLGGVAIWRLGFEDKELFQAIEDVLASPAQAGG